MGDFTKPCFDGGGELCRIFLDPFGQYAAIRFEHMFKLCKIIGNGDIDVTAAVQNIGLEVRQAAIKRFAECSTLNDNGLFKGFDLAR